MFPIILILGISTEGYYQFDMTKLQLNLRTANDVIFWLLLYWFQTLIKLKLYSKLQMFLIKLILGISTEGYYQLKMTKLLRNLITRNDVIFWLLIYWFQTSIKLKLYSKFQMFPTKLYSKLQMFPIKLILGISTEEYYQFDMTKIQLNLKTMNDVIFWLLLYWFQTSIKLKLYSKLQKFLIKLRSSCGW